MNRSRQFKKLLISSISLSTLIVTSSCTEKASEEKDTKSKKSEKSSRSKPVIKILPSADTLVVDLKGVKTPPEPWKYRPKAETKEEKQAVKLINEASQLFSEEQYKESLDLVSKATEIAPEFAHAWYSKAVICTQMRKKDEAQYSALKACRLDSQFFSAWYILACQYNIQKRLNEGNLILQALANKAPDDPETWIKLGMIFIDQQKGKKAESCFKKAIKLDPKNLRGYYYLGFDYHCMGMWAEAETCYKKALTIKGDDPVIWQRLYQVQGKQNKEKEYLESLKKYRELVKDHSGIIYSKGIALLEAGKPEESKAVFEKMIKDNPKDPSGYRGLGVVYFIQRDFEKAHKLFTLGLKVNPNSSNLIQLVAECKLKLHLYQECIDFLKPYAKKYGDNPVIIASLSRAYFLNHQFKEAEKLALTLTKNHPENPGGWYYLADTLAGQNKTAEAIAALKRSINLNPRLSGHIWGNLATQLISLDKLEEAEKALKKGELLFPKNEAINTSYGIYYKKKRDYKKAEDYLEKALKLDNDSAYIWSQYAEVLGVQGKKNEQEKALKKAITSSGDTEYVNYYQIGFNLEKLGKKEEATKAMKKAGAIAPDEMENILVTPNPVIKEERPD